MEALVKAYEQRIKRYREIEAEAETHTTAIMNTPTRCQRLLGGPVEPRVNHIAYIPSLDALKFAGRYLIWLGIPRDIVRIIWRWLVVYLPVNSALGLRISRDLLASTTLLLKTYPEMAGDSTFVLRVEIMGRLRSNPGINNLIVSVRKTTTSQSDDNETYVSSVFNIELVKYEKYENCVSVIYHRVDLRKGSNFYAMMAHIKDQDIVAGALDNAW